MSVAQLEPLLSWQDLGDKLGGLSKRWLEDKVRKGMPSGYMGGKRVFQFSKALAWLEQNGYYVEPR